jgi:hypothetical protein
VELRPKAAFSVVGQSEIGFSETAARGVIESAQNIWKLPDKDDGHDATDDG